MESSANFDFYGVTLQVECDDPETLQRVCSDFSHFRVGHPSAEPPSLRITAERRKPNYDALPAIKARVYTPRNICYPDGDVTYIDYFGRALSLYDRARSTLHVQSDNVHMLHEVVFLSVLSRIGEQLERRKMHRVHSLAIDHNGEAALFMMPSGGGKTSLAMTFLSRELPYLVLSEDSPLIDEHGRIHPFPLRFGVAGEMPEGIADEHVTYVERMEFEPKNLISLEAFEGSIAQSSSQPRFLFIGERNLGRDCAIRPISRMAGLKPLMRDMVVGVGLYQGVEFLFRTSALDLFRNSLLFVSRLRRALTLLRSCEVYVIDLGRDRELNASTVVSFLQAKDFGGLGSAGRDKDEPGTA